MKRRKKKHFQVNIIKASGPCFFSLCCCSTWEQGLWNGVGVRYLPASRWLRLLLSRRMGAASIFQLALSGNPLNWIFTGPMFSARVSPLKSTFLFLVKTGQMFFSLIRSLCLSNIVKGQWLITRLHRQNRRFCRQAKNRKGIDDQPKMRICLVKENSQACH